MLLIRPAAVNDVPLLLRFFCELAEYERQPNAVVIEEETLVKDGFGSQPKPSLTSVSSSMTTALGWRSYSANSQKNLSSNGTSFTAAGRIKSIKNSPSLKS